MNESQRQDERRSIVATQALLASPIDEKLIRWKPSLYRKGEVDPFLTWQTLAGLLAQRAPGWCGEIAKVEHVGGHFVVVVRIIIKCSDGSFYREGVGYALDEPKPKYGTPLKRAEADAFKDACYKLRLAADLFDEDDTKALEGEQASVVSEGSIPPDRGSMPPDHQKVPPSPTSAHKPRSGGIDPSATTTQQQQAQNNIETQRRRRLGEIKDYCRRHQAVVDFKAISEQAMRYFKCEHFDRLSFDQLGQVQRKVEAIVSEGSCPPKQLQRAS